MVGEQDAAKNHSNGIGIKACSYARHTRLLQDSIRIPNNTPAGGAEEKPKNCEIFCCCFRSHYNARMNPNLNKLQPYPFQRLRDLFQGITPNPQFSAINL